MVILLVFHAGDPGSIPAEGNTFDKLSHQPRFFFFHKYSNPNRIIKVMVTDMRLCHVFKFAFCQRTFMLMAGRLPKEQI